VEHYYSTYPTSKHNLRTIKARLRGKEFLFQTDAGVFSKEHIDPGTKTLINSLEWNKCRAPLDLGCGYGPIGLIIADELRETIVRMSDVNHRAVELARKNAELNGLTNIRIEEGEDFLPWEGEVFDLIVTNPPLRAGKNKVLALFYQAKEHLVSMGTFWVVIRTNQGAKSYAREMKEIFGAVETVEIKSGYRVLKATKN